jgi:hypothetical protein
MLPETVDPVDESVKYTVLPPATGLRGSVTVNRRALAVAGSASTTAKSTTRLARMNRRDIVPPGSLYPTHFGRSDWGLLRQSPSVPWAGKTWGTAGK